MALPDLYYVSNPRHPLYGRFGPAVNEGNDWLHIVIDGSTFRFEKARVRRVGYRP